MGLKSLFSIFFIPFIIATVLQGCASQNSGMPSSQELRIRYARVVEVERVQMQSAAPAGAIIGGFTGLVLSSRGSTAQRLGATAGGAALGGLATKALEGDNRGYGYRIRYPNGMESRFITEKDYFRTGDCVSVEVGKYANLRRVPDSLKRIALPLGLIPVGLRAEDQQVIYDIIDRRTGRINAQAG